MVYQLQIPPPSAAYIEESNTCKQFYDILAGKHS